MFQYTTGRPAPMSRRGVGDSGTTYDKAIEAGVRESVSRGRRDCTTCEPQQNVHAVCRKRWSYYVFRQGIRMLLEPGCW